MNASTPHSVILAATVDRLAQVKAEIARLKLEEDALKQALVDTGIPVIEGTLHRAAIAQCQGRDTTDWRAVAEHFKPSRQLITAHTTTGEPFTSVRLSARKTA